MHGRGIEMNQKHGSSVDVSLWSGNEWEEILTRGVLEVKAA